MHDLKELMKEIMTVIKEVRKENVEYMHKVKELREENKQMKNQIEILKEKVGKGIAKLRMEK